MTDKQLTRIYVVAQGEKKRLVRAASQAAALAHVVKPQFTVATPSPDELVELTLKGVKIEEAGGA